MTNEERLDHLESNQQLPTLAPAQSAPATLETAPVRCGRFRLGPRHAVGGLGEVFLAEDEELHRTIAFKRMRAEKANNHDLRRRFVLEAEVTAKLEHPGIVPIYGLVEGPDGQPYYAMRFIEGETLKDAIQRYPARPRRGDQSSSNRLAFRNLLTNFVAICKTMAYAHSRNIIHRDLKPANVLLGKFGETLVVDWGIAKQIGVTSEESEVGKEVNAGEGSSPPTVTFAVDTPGQRLYTQAGRALGTPMYMSPEQAAGRWNAVGPISDIYSLGAILYELLTGQHPIDRQDALEVLQMVQTGDFPAPRTVNSSVPKPLEAICMKAMALKPENRYQSATDLAEDVEHWLADEPVAAYREPYTVRLRRWGRRHRSIVASAVAAVFVAAVCLGALAWVVEGKNTSLREERDRADRNFALARDARDRADQNFNLARDAVEATVNKVAEHPRLKEADFTVVRKELLATVVPMYEAMVRQRSDDPALESARGQAYGRLAFVRAEMGDRPKAIADYQQAGEIFAQLAAQFPASRDYRWMLACNQNNLGNQLSELGQLPDAEKAIHRALDLQAQLASESPNVPECRVALARSHNNLGHLARDQSRLQEAQEEFEHAVELLKQLPAEFRQKPDARQELARSYVSLGSLLRDTGRRNEAAEPLRASVAIFTQLVADVPAVAEYREELAGSHNATGVLLLLLGRHAEAEKEYRCALSIQERLLADFPNVSIYRLQVGGACVNLGNVAREQGQPADSLPWLARAIAVLEPLIAQNPSFIPGRTFLRNAYANRALSLDQLGRSAEATTDWDRAIVLAAPSERPFMRGQWAISLAGAKDYGSAIAGINALASAKDETPEKLYDLAGVCALAAAAVKYDDQGADRYAVRAIELLRQAIAMGFKDSERLKKDDGFTALREREDFKKLVKELEGNNKP